MSRPEQIYILEPTSSTKTSPLASGIITSPISTDLQTSPSLCRICASSTKLVLPIFEQEGLENNLAEKIQKYLPIQVSQDDLLPKVVCFQCTTTILTWHELVATCQQADTTLRSQVTLGIVEKGSENAYSDNMSKGPPPTDAPATRATYAALHDALVEFRSHVARSHRPPSSPAALDDLSGALRGGGRRGGRHGGGRREGAPAVCHVCGAACRSGPALRRHERRHDRPAT